MTRLRYKNMYDVLVTDWFTVGPNLVIRGVINLETNYYEIREFDFKLISNGNAFNLRKAKSQVKKILEQSGVNFSGEIRGR